MKRFENILVSTDVRYHEHPAVTEAVKIAIRSKARLTLIDVIPSTTLFARLAIENYNHLNTLLIDDKRKKLEELAQPIREQGIEVETVVGQGKTSAEIIHQVLRAENDLVMRTTKARGSSESGFFGRTSSRLLRECPCPVWVLRPEKSSDYTKILACVDTATDSETDHQLNDLVYNLAADVGSYHETRHSIVHAWSIWNQQMLMSRMSKDEFSAVLKKTEKQEESLYAKFLERHNRKLTDEDVYLLKGEPQHVIPALAEQMKVDLIVMGTVGRSGIYGAIMGNAAESILASVRCDVLAVKPEGFRCPVKPDKSHSRKD